MYKKYSAQIAIPEIGIDGQEKILNSSVLIIGLGGLGCPTALQLVYSGVGKIGIVENDIIEESNLARQILYKPSDIKKNKINIAYQNLKDANPEIEIIKHECFLDEKNAIQIIDQYKIIIDCTDNFTSRYLINDTCYFLKKILISGMVFQFDGRMISLNFQNSETPCMRCIYPIIDNQVQSCANAGVTNSITGIIGSIQSSEVIKNILQIQNKDQKTFLIMFDSLHNRFKKIELQKNINCELCGINKIINKIEEIKMNSNCPNANYNIEKFLSEIKNEEIIILDVRTFEERIIDGIIPNDIHIQLDFLQHNLDKLEKFQNKKIVIYCRSGIRSAKAVQFLKEQNYKNVINLEGGIKAYNLYFQNK